MYMPSGLKHKTVILHATTTTTTKVKLDHTKRALLTHMPPPQASVKEFLGGGEGVVNPPLPRGKPEKVTVEELLLLSCCKVNKRTKKKDKYD